MKDFNYYYNLFLDMLDLYEFDLAVDEENYWRVIDRQGGNLGGIEQEQFNTIADIVDRMEAYHNDYIVEALENCFPEIEHSNWEDLYKELIALSNYYNYDLSEFEFKEDEEELVNIKKRKNNKIFGPILDYFFDN